MNAESLIDESLPLLYRSEPLSKAIDWMDEYKLSHWPVLNSNNSLLGIVSEQVIYEQTDWNKSIDSIENEMLHAEAEPFDHLTEVVRKMEKQGLTCIPVIDKKSGDYRGAITHDRIIHGIGKIDMVGRPGGVIVLQTTQVDYSAAEIAQIIESDNQRLYSLYTKSEPDSNRLYVTIKVGTKDIAGLLRSLERFNYTIAASYYEENETEELKDNFDNLMNFLNI